MLRIAGLVDDGTHGVVIPTIGIVIGDDDGGIGPFLRLLQPVDGIHQEGLLV